MPAYRSAAVEAATGPLWARWCPACDSPLRPFTSPVWRERWYRCAGCRAAYSPDELRPE